MHLRSVHNKLSFGALWHTVVHPSRDHWVEHPREIFERFVALQLQPPTSDILTRRLCGARRHCRSEVREETSMPIEASSRTEVVAQEIELNVFVLVPSMEVFAIDDPCLIRMKFQSALLESLRK